MPPQIPAAPLSPSALGNLPEQKPDVGVWAGKATAQMADSTGFSSFGSSIGSSAASSTQSSASGFSFTHDQVIRVLREHPGGLEPREVCLLLQGRNPRTDKAESDHIRAVKRVLYSRADIGVVDPNAPRPKFYWISM